jgi:hypothetical protein
MNYGGYWLGNAAGAGWVFGTLIRLAQYAALLGALLNLGRGRGVGLVQALLAGLLLWLHRKIATAEVLPPSLQSPYRGDVGCIWLVAAPLLSLALLVWVFGF